MNVPFVKSTAEGVILAVKLQPRASRQQIVGPHGNELKISVTAPPVDAAANRALIDFLATVLDMPRASVELIRGQTSRHKIILVRGMTVETFLERLQLRDGST